MVPFSSRVTSDGSVELAYRGDIERLITGLKQKGHTIFCALEYTGWKMGGSTAPEDELRHDFEQIDASDTLIALLEEKVSAGIQLECGYAHAKNKKIDMYQIGKTAWSNSAFATLNGNKIISVKDIPDFVDQVLNRI